jgi:hypothetical protein
MFPIIISFVLFIMLTGCERQFLTTKKEVRGAVGIFADVLLSKGRVRMPVSTLSEQSELLERIEHNLSSLGSHARNKRQKNKRERRKHA